MRNIFLQFWCKAGEAFLRKKSGVLDFSVDKFASSNGSSFNRKRPWMDEEGMLLWLVLRRLDGKTLARACTVCREWRKAGGNEDLWKQLSCEKWPSVATDGGKRVLECFSGSYRHFYGERSKAARFRCHPPPSLKVLDLTVMLDISSCGETIASIIRAGDELVPLHPAHGWDGSMFRFSLNVTMADFARRRKVMEVDSFETHTSLESESIGKLKDLKAGTVRKYRRCEVKNFEVNWAIMVNGSSKIVQILQTMSGIFVDNVCSFSARLPLISGSLASNLNAEVDLVFGAALKGTTMHDDTRDRGFLNYSTFTEARLSIINSDTWRYISQAEALGYLQHLLQTEST